MNEMTVSLDMNKRRKVTLCNHNFSQEGILHPDRVMDEYDLLFMQNGEWDIIEDGTEYHLSPGSVLLLEPGKHHYSIKKCTPMMRNVYIHFEKTERDIPAKTNSQDTEAGTLNNSPTQFATDDIDINQKTFSPTTNDITKPISNFLFLPKLVQTADHPEIRHGFERVIDAFWSAEDSTKALRCSLYLESLLLQLSDLGNVTKGKTDILVSEIIHRFHCEPEIFLSPEELAKDYNVSVRTISGRFKQYTGMSVHQYQLQVKLDMAYDLLPISPGRSLHDIALSYGFYDEFQFSKLFKRKFGISPSARR